MKYEKDRPADKMSEYDKVERPIGLDFVLQEKEVRMLELLELNSFEHLQYAFEEILNDAPLFEGDSTFGQAAIALDTAAKMFPYIDHDGDHMISIGELESYLKQDTARNVEALRWLVVHFDAFTKASFFKDAITRDDIEEARNVFHGLHHLHDQFGFDGAPTAENLSKVSVAAITQSLHDKQGKLEKHDEAGLRGLLAYISKVKKS